MKKIIETNNAPKAIGPYSQAVEANGFVFTSGQIPIDPNTGKLLNGTITEQTIRVLKNLEAILAAAGCNMGSVIKTTCFLKSMDDFAAMNEAYSSFFAIAPPARSTVEVARLPKDVLVEIEAIAIKS
ncbi:MAG: RidA family protein [Bacteroidales bacterium]|nr:RidA family protein [Bacteroidales bacterium]